MKHIKVLGAVFLALLVGLSAALVGLSACKSDPSVSLRFRYWGDPEEVRILTDLLAEFERAHPGVKIRSERKSPDDSYSDVLLQEFAAGTAPDVMFLSSDHIGPLARASKLEDLSPYLGAAGSGLAEGEFFPSAIGAFKFDGRLLALPRDIAPVSCVFYNKRLFDEAGLPYPRDDWDWEGLRAAALKLTQRDKDGRVSRWGFADDWNLVDAWILAGGGAPLDDDAAPKRFSFAEPAALAGIQFRHRLLHQDQVMPFSSDSQALNGGAMALFQNEQLAMFHSGLWKTPSLRSITRFEWDLAPFPLRRGAKGRYLTGASGYAMRRGVKDPALAWELIRHMGGPDGQARLAATGLAQPALRSLSKSPVFLDGKDPKNKAVMLACADRGRFSPSWERWKEFQRAFWGPRTDALWVKGSPVDPAELVPKVQAEAQAAFFGAGQP
jgi:multiple sugar transport system substrate-binding protein